ncbi:MAG: tRNA (adenosine(37)-N6)-dimethylallyltransferase MiaA [Bryobacteraceae bacterium]|nr:tRNA (adenosine(37)-N6)-dimethylallyltransferase MiaA [Bryobacteraceae bacterium]
MGFRRYTKKVSGPPARPLVAILGPTASGKSALALYLAERYQGEIVNCDSLQVYRGLDIGTAKVPPADRGSIPHHLIDLFDPGDSCDAGRFANLATSAIHGIARRGLLPILAGGTGFYLRALLDGLSPAPRRDERVRLRLGAIEERRPGRLHQFLRRLDPATAARIHPRDRQKLARAVEICLLEGRSATEVFESRPRPIEGFTTLKLALDPLRGDLRDRIGARTRAMFAAGLVEEVRGLLRGGLPPDARPLGAIGYKQACAVIEGRIAPEEAIQLAFHATCQYAKRQMTWFRREPGITFLAGFGADADVQAAAARLVERFLESLQPPSGI